MKNNPGHQFNWKILSRAPSHRLKQKSLVDEYTETTEEVKWAEITPFENKNNYEYNSCKVYIILMIAVFTIFTGITVYLVYYNWSLINNNIYFIKFSTHKKKQKSDEWNYIKCGQQSK